jgi:hypothetical protein
VRGGIALAIVATIGCTLDKSGSGTDLGLGRDAGTVVVDTSVVVPDTSVADTFVAIDTALPIDAPADAAEEAEADTRVCATPTGGTLCTKIPAFAGTQTVDGLDDDFCDVNGVSWWNTDGDFISPSAPPDAGKVRVRMKFAWDGVGLHAFVDVQDANVITDPNPTYLWRGDSVELYLAGFSKLTGRFDTTNDAGAFQVVISPPSGATPAQSQIFLTGAASGPLASGKWTAVATPTGYAVEVQIPWSDLHGMGIAAGSQIGLDVAVNSKWDPATDHVFSVWRRRMVSGATPCGANLSPSCDDRTWCTPSLD